MSFLERLITPLVLLAALAAAEPRRDPAFQTAIEQAVSSVARQDEDMAARVDALRALGQGRREELLLQLALYLESSEGTEQSMSGALILHQLGFTPREKLDAALPHLTSAGPGLRRVLTELLSTVDRPEGGDPDFSVYEETLRRSKDAPPEGLILYLFDVSPDAALDTLERIYGVASSRPPRATSASDLAGLARDPAWWRRLYAAAAAREHPELATPEITSRLKSDPHPLVRKAATAS